MSLIYLASPYSAPTAEQREDRFKQVCRMAARVMDNDFEVFCPIAHSHPIEVYGMPEIRSGDFWLKQDFALLSKCDELWVYQIDGWDRSDGVMREVDYAYTNGIPVYFIKDNAFNAFNIANYPLAA